MANHLERRTPNQVESAGGRTSTVEAGRATEISEIDFGGRALDHSTDMPRAFREGAKASTQLALQNGGQATSGGELIVADPEILASITPSDEAAARRAERNEFVSSVRQLDRPRRSAGRVVQRRVGWRATPDRIIITVAERELKKNHNGTYSPNGPWLIELRRTFKDISGKASRRTGSVPADPRQYSGQTGANTGTEGLESSVAQQFPDGAEALSALPAAVRASAIARVPSPTEFEGQLLEFSDNTGQTLRWEAKVVRMDVHRAVVLTAVRETRSATWSVTQATYNLSSPELEQA
jgi:hypothetical protein